MNPRTVRRTRVLAPGDDHEVRGYDFTAPELLQDWQRRGLDSAFDAFARQFSVQLTAKTRIVTTVEYVSFAMLPFAVVEDRLPVDSGFVLASVDGSSARMLYQVPSAEALLWTSRMVGGTGTRPLPERPLTGVERALLWRMADEHLGELRLAMHGLLPEIAVDSFAVGLGTEVAEPDELMLAVAFRLEREDRDPVEIAIAIPAVPVLAAFGRAIDDRPADEVTGLLEQHLTAAAVEVGLRFDDVRVKPQVVLGLGAGDVIPLGHPRHRPLAITVDGDRVAHAAVGANGERLACVVVDYEEAS